MLYRRRLGLHDLGLHAVAHLRLAYWCECQWAALRALGLVVHDPARADLYGVGVGVSERVSGWISTKHRAMMDGGTARGRGVGQL